jgi:hypothetical protein
LRKRKRNYSRLEEGADFGQLAIRYSDSQTGLEGGDLGWREGSQLPTLFSDVVAEMSIGDFSQPIRAVSGFHLVKVLDLRGVNQKSEIQQVKVRHILIAPNEIIDDQTAKQQLEGAVERIKGGEDFGEVAKLMSDDPGSANNGGEMEWSGPGWNQAPCPSRSAAGLAGTSLNSWIAESTTIPKISRNAAASSACETASSPTSMSSGLAESETKRSSTREFRKTIVERVTHGLFNSRTVRNSYRFTRPPG